jgi:hypothetical protein
MLLISAVSCVVGFDKLVAALQLCSQVSEISDRSNGPVQAYMVYPLQLQHIKKALQVVNLNLQSATIHSATISEVLNVRFRSGTASFAGTIFAVNFLIRRVACVDLSSQ